MTLTFNKLRNIKDNLPPGSMGKIADKLDLDEETVRNCFGGANYEKGESCGIHVEQGPDGGIVKIDNPAIIKIAFEIIDENQQN